MLRDFLLDYHFAMFILFLRLQVDTTLHTPQVLQNLTEILKRSTKGSPVVAFGQLCLETFEVYVVVSRNVRNIRCRVRRSSKYTYWCQEKFEV